MGSPQSLALLVGRIFLAVVFIVAGYGKIGGFDGTVGYVASKGLPLPQVLAALAIVVELGAGLALVVGFKTRWAALVLVIFTAVATYVFHPFWAVPAAEKAAQWLTFQKNLAIIGGLLVLAAAGAGRFSIDRR